MLSFSMMIMTFQVTGDRTWSCTREQATKLLRSSDAQAATPSVFTAAASSRASLLQASSQMLQGTVRYEGVLDMTAAPISGAVGAVNSSYTIGESLLQGGAQQDHSDRHSQQALGQVWDEALQSISQLLARARDRVGIKPRGPARYSGWQVFYASVSIFLLIVFVMLVKSAHRFFSGTRDATKTPGEADQSRGTPPPEPSEMEKFCMELVVPADHECVLVLPKQPVTGTCNIRDFHGDDVLLASADKQTPWHLVLRSKSGETLAQCCDARPSAAEYHFLKASDEHFAKLREEEEPYSYTLHLADGTRLSIKGVLSDQPVSITDDGTGAVVATTEPADDLVLRIAPLVNAGIALCCIFCVAHHQGSYIQ
jgi:hypothetical protein